MSIYQGGNLMPRVAKDDINLVEHKKTANSKKTTAKSTSSKPGTKKAQSAKVSESSFLMRMRHVLPSFLPCSRRTRLRSAAFLSRGRGDMMRYYIWGA